MGAVNEEIKELAAEIERSRKIMNALGDEMRQHLILIMIQNGDCRGMRVNDIAEKTSLSRPAVSHHLQIMNDAGIVKVRKEGTRNFYYFDADMEAFDSLIQMLMHARQIMLSLPDRSGGMIRVHVLSCGSTVVDEALPFSDRSLNPFAWTGILRGKKHRMTVPVTAYLIEHPKGNVLVDTGWDSLIRTDPKTYEGFLNYFASPGFLPEGEAVDEQLKRLGLLPADLEYCILTHLDIDHAGGIGLVKDARRIMCNEAEKAAGEKNHPRYVHRLWKDIHLETFPDEEYDLFHDGSVVLLPMHGHSAGMTAVRVGTNGKYLLIAADAGYGRRSWEEQILPGVIWNRKEARKSLQKLREYALDPACLAVLMTHDTEMNVQMIEI